MQTQDQTGIICDLCKTTNKEDFHYYSVNAMKVKQYNNRRPPISEIVRQVPDKSFDFCTACYDNISDEVVRVYTSSMNNKTGIAKHFCEMTGFDLLSASVYYYLVFGKVSVNMSRQPFVCLKCGKNNLSKNVCSCGSVDFRKNASIDVSSRDLEICVCEDTYSGWVSKQSVPVASSWSSSS
jgi:hypothetical protein